MAKIPETVTNDNNKIVILVLLYMAGHENYAFKHFKTNTSKLSSFCNIPFKTQLMKKVELVIVKNAVLKN